MLALLLYINILFIPNEKMGLDLERVGITMGRLGIMISLPSLFSNPLKSRERILKNKNYNKTTRGVGIAIGRVEDCDHITISISKFILR